MNQYPSRVRKQGHSISDTLNNDWKCSTLTIFLSEKQNYVTQYNQKKKDISEYGSKKI